MRCEVSDKKVAFNPVQSNGVSIDMDKNMGGYLRLQWSRQHLQDKYNTSKGTIGIQLVEVEMKLAMKI